MQQEQTNTNHHAIVFSWIFVNVDTVDEEIRVFNQLLKALQ